MPLHNGGMRCSFIADPAQVHFPVSHPGYSMRRYVNIVNGGKLSARLHVLPVKSPNFKVVMDLKDRFIAPGMHQRIEVSCCPDSHEVVQESICIHGEVIGLPGDSRQLLVIPVCSFPAATSVAFPKFLDFGNVHIGTCVRRNVTLAVDIAVAFEFQLCMSVLESDFQVSPTSGVIPANGCISISVEFHPTKLITHRAELTLEVSQFNTDPLTCVLLGVARPGAIRDDTIKAYLGKLPSTMSELDGQHHLDNAKRQMLRMSDRGARHKLRPIDDAKKRPRNSASTSKAAAALPERLNHSTVARILGRPDEEAQQARARAETSAQHDLAQDEISEQLSPLENYALAADTRLAIFMEQLQRAKEEEKRVHSSFQVRLGQDPPTQEELDRKAALRAEHAARMRAREAEAAACRTETELHVAGALSMHCHAEASTDAVLGDQAQASEDGAGADPLSPAADHLRADPASTGVNPVEANPSSTGADPLGADPFPNSPGEAGSAGKDRKPHRPPEHIIAALECGETFDDVAKRVYSRRRFVEAGRLIVFRNRANKRLRKIQALLQQLGWDKARVQQEVETPDILAPDEMGERPGLHPAQVRAVTDTTTSLPPQFSEVNFFRMETLDVAPCGSLTELAFAELEVPLECERLGYEREDHFGLEEYIPQMQHMVLESGAVEEEEVEPAPLAPVAAYTPEGFEPWHAELPAAAMRSAAHVESIGAKWLRTQTGVYAAELPVWGMDPDYLPEPVELARRCCAEREAPESMALHATTGLPMLSDVWRPRHGNHVLELVAGAADCLPADAEEEPAVSSSLAGLAGLEVPVRLPTKEAVGKWLPAGVPNNLVEGVDAFDSLLDKYRPQEFEGLNHEREEARVVANSQLQRKMDQHRAAFDDAARQLNSLVDAPTRHHI
eukprot:jgi/Ulvmu1/6158/UM028_0014.1